jgi:hypothetical protein
MVRPNKRENLVPQGRQMSNYKRYVPFSVLSLTAAVIAMAIAWEPGEAEANKKAEEGPVLRTSIIERGGIKAPACPDAVWPHVTKDCLLHPSETTAERSVRTIEIDDRTFNAKRKVLREISIGL